MFHSALLSKINFIEHCFFGRDYDGSFGGKSKGEYQSLNTSYRMGDDAKNVGHNRQLIASYFGVSSQNLITLHQIHSTKVEIITTDSMGQNWQDVKADGLITTEKNIILGISTADCIPILMVDINNKSVSAIHCGWQGLLHGIIENNILKHNEIAEVSPNIVVAIGPCIKQNSYEVQLSFYNDFIIKDDSSRDFFKPHKNGGFLFDLSGYAKFRLIKAGINNDNIDILKNDTFLEDHSFFSHRRMTKSGGNKKGLQMSCIKVNL